jgi:hypothetical protein
MCECGTEQSVGRSIWPSGDASGGALKWTIDWEKNRRHSVVTGCRPDGRGVRLFRDCPDGDGAPDRQIHQPLTQCALVEDDRHIAPDQDFGPIPTLIRAAP